MTVYINGRFLTQKITGVQRYAIETIKALDKMNLKEEIVILHPKNKIQDLELKNIKLQQIGKLEGYFWEQISLPFFLKKKKASKLISFCNIAPILFPGYVVIHDIGFKTQKKHLSKKFCMVYQFITSFNIKRYQHIFTVSNFSKNEILQNYPVEQQKISVTYNSAEHIKNIIPDPKIIQRLGLEGKEFNFSLGSKSYHKNHKFILECAQHNHNKLFVISGNRNDKIFKEEKQEALSNVIYTGYLTDSELVAMYQKCENFIFPSLYEGFGIPPLEAMTVGCKNIILSDIPVFREIYGENVQYIQENEAYELPQGKQDTNEKTELLEKYSWKKVAEIIVRKVGVSNEK